MKKIVLIKKFLILLISVVSYQANAQITLTPEMTSSISIRAQETVGHMTDCISAMSGPGVSLADRNKFKESALKLFAGAGVKSYTIGGVMHKPVSMEVTSINSVGRVVTSLPKPMPDYYNRLINMATGGRYASLDITFTDVYDMKVSSLKPMSDGTYQCTVTYVQYTRNQRKDGSTYIDDTEKTIQCYIEVEDTIDGKEFIVKLGDVKANETVRR